MTNAKLIIYLSQSLTLNSPVVVSQLFYVISSQLPRVVYRMWVLWVKPPLRATREWNDFLSLCRAKLSRRLRLFVNNKSRLNPSFVEIWTGLLFHWFCFSFAPLFAPFLSKDFLGKRIRLIRKGKLLLCKMREGTSLSPASLSMRSDPMNERN